MVDSLGKIVKQTESTSNHYGNKTTEERCVIQLLISSEVALQKICSYCRKCAAVAENLQLLEKICSYCRKCAQNMQDMFPPGKYAKSISRNAHYVIAFKNPRDQLGMRNLLLQAFPTCWQDMMDVYQKVTERPFGYTVLDLHPASDDRKRVFSHLLTHEGYPRWHRRIKKEDV